MALKVHEQNGGCMSFLVQERLDRGERGSDRVAGVFWRVIWRHGVPLPLSATILKSHRRIFCLRTPSESAKYQPKGNYEASRNEKG